MMEESVPSVEREGFVRAGARSGRFQSVRVISLGAEHPRLLARIGSFAMEFHENHTRTHVQAIA